MQKIFFILVFLFVANNLFAQDPVRGIWMTNVGSKVMYSNDSLIHAVKQCKAIGINHIFVVVWNKGVTLYPSKVLSKYIGIDQDPLFKGRDPIQELISAAHKENIKVHAWFEFGFSYAYKDTTNIWLKRYPEWAGKDVKGGLLNKNGFYWWNALHPGPQHLLRELMLEVVKQYKIDGVQGDDRLPAMPAEGGWDLFTAQLYEQSTHRLLPKHNPLDTAFLQWKADKLSEYAKSLYTSVKEVNPNCTVSWAPSIYPWSKQQYLQDWPKWLKEGYADYIFPQLYRYQLSAYEKIISELSDQIPTELKSKVFPGVLSSLGDGYQAPEQLLTDMIKLNRKYGFNGEVFFYYETLNRIKKWQYQ